MNCRKVNHLLSAYMDGELPGVEHRQVHEHIQQCSECYSEYVGLLRVKRMVSGMRIKSPQAALPERILSRIHAEESRPRRSPPAWMQLRNWWRRSAPPVPSLAFGAGLAMLGMFMVIRITDSDSELVFEPKSQQSILELPRAPITASSDLSVSSRGVRAVSGNSFSLYEPVSRWNVEPASSFEPPATYDVMMRRSEPIPVYPYYVRPTR